MNCRVQRPNGFSAIMRRPVPEVSRGLVWRPSLGIVQNARFQPETFTLLTQMDVQPTWRRKVLIDYTIRLLKEARVWSAIDWLYMFAAHTDQAGRLNWKSPSLYPMLHVSGSAPAAFSVDLGVRGNADGTTIQRNGIAVTALGGFSQNSAHMGTKVAAVGTSVGGAVGTSDAGFNNFILPRNSVTALTDYTINSASAVTSLAGGNLGYYVANRQDSANMMLYKNGVLFSGPTARASSAPTGQAQLGTGNLGDDNRVSIGHWGRALTTEDVAALEVIFDNYIAELPNTDF